MEHHLRSPSRTYSDMPEMRKADAHVRPQPQHSPVPTTSLAETERQRFLQAKTKGIFVPSTQIPASLFRHLESPVSGNEEEVEIPDVDLGGLDNPTPGSSRDVTGQKDATTHKVHPFNPYEAPRASTSSGYSRDDGSVEVIPRSLLRNDNDVEVIVVQDSDSDSSAESNATRSFFKESRLPYGPAEDEEIINFVFSGNNIERTGSLLLWKELEARKENPKRTYQSLKNRFMRNIKPFLLTKYRHLLTPDIIRLLKRKYPDLKIIEPPPVVPKRTLRPNYNEKRVICVNPSMENMPTTYYADRHFGIINLTTTTEASEPEKNDLDKSDSSSMCSATCNHHVKETQDAAVGSEEAMDSRPGNEADDANQMWLEPGTSTSQLERSVNIFAKEKLLDVPIQTFKYYESMKAFSNKAAVNLKLILDREGAQVLPADLPISVSVTVTIGKEEHLESKALVQTPASNSGDNFDSKTDKSKNKESKKGSKKSSKKGYVLKVKEKYTKRFRNESKWFARAADSLIYKDKVERVMDTLKSDIAHAPTNSPSDTEHRNSFTEDFSQYTNCSTEDESCYTQTLKKVSHMYQVEVRSTQSLIEDESQESLSLLSSQTPRTLENPRTEDKETLRGNLAMNFGDSFLTGHSLNESVKI